MCEKINKTVTERRTQLLKSESKNKDPDFFNKVNSELYALQSQEISGSYLPGEVKHSLLNYLRACEIHRRHMQFVEYKMQQFKEQEIMEFLKIKNPIRFRFKKWRDKYLLKLRAQERAKLLAQKEKDML